MPAQQTQQDQTQSEQAQQELPQLEQISAAQYRRVIVLVLAHLPAVLCGVILGWFWALLYVFALHMLVLWNTLNPHSTLFGTVLRRTASKHIWLTIDDGPSSDTQAVLDLLKRHQAKATFFLVAERAHAQPELVKAIVNSGHDIGNHSATHPSAWFWALPPARMTQEIMMAQRILTDLLMELTGTKPRWFRSVAGHTNPFVQPVLRQLGLQRVAWSVRAYDAVDGNTQRVVSRLTERLQPGAIVLLHEGASHGNSVAIIEQLLESLQRRGLRAALPT